MMEFSQYQHKLLQKFYMYELEINQLFEKQYKYSLLEGRDECLIKLYSIYQCLKQKILFILKLSKTRNSKYLSGHLY